MIYLILFGLAIVLGILFLGLFNMVRSGNEENRNQRSQQFMRWRVLGQGAVIVLLILAALIAG